MPECFLHHLMDISYSKMLKVSQMICLKDYDSTLISPTILPAKLTALRFCLLFPLCPYIRCIFCPFNFLTFRLSFQFNLSFYVVSVDFFCSSFSRVQTWRMLWVLLFSQIWVSNLVPCMPPFHILQLFSSVWQINLDFLSF